MQNIDKDLDNQSTDYITKKSFLKTHKDKFYYFFSKTQIYMFPFFFVAIILILIPVLFVFVYSFTTKSAGDTQAYFNITFSYYAKMFHDSTIWNVLGISVLFAFTASIICILLAYPIAYVLAGVNKKIYYKNLWIIITLPTWISVILKTIGLQCVFNVLMPSALGTSFAVIIGMVYLFLPFAIVPISNALINQDPIYYQAALDLKAGKVKAFLDIKLRYSFYGIASAFNIIFIQAATSLVIVKYIALNNVTMAANLIENYFLKGNNLGYSAVISTVLVLLVVLVLGITKLISKWVMKKGE